MAQGPNIEVGLGRDSEPTGEGTEAWLRAQKGEDGTGVGPVPTGDGLEPSMWREERVKGQEVSAEPAVR